jgi:hypothetical protein
MGHAEFHDDQALDLFGGSGSLEKTTYGLKVMEMFGGFHHDLGWQEYGSPALETNSNRCLLGPVCILFQTTLF